MRATVASISPALDRDRSPARTPTAPAHRQARGGDRSRRSAMALDQRHRDCAERHRDRDGATSFTVHSTFAVNARPIARELVLEEAVVEAGVVRDEDDSPATRPTTSSAICRKVGASATIALVMPVSAWISGGMLHSGLTSVLHSPTCRLRRRARCRSRSRGRRPRRCPVVSRSRKARAGANMAGCVGPLDGTNDRSLVYTYCRTIVPTWPRCRTTTPGTGRCRRTRRSESAGSALEVVGRGAGGAAQARAASSNRPRIAGSRRPDASSSGRWPKRRCTQACPIRSTMRRPTR